MLLFRMCCYCAVYRSVNFGTTLVIGKLDEQLILLMQENVCLSFERSVPWHLTVIV